MLHQKIIGRAVELGALEGVNPTQTSSSPECWEFEVDEDRISIFNLTYHPNTQTFAGWNAGANTPEWEEPLRLNLNC